MSLRESLLSIGSRILHRHDDDDEYDVMNLEELQEIHDDLLQKIWVLTLENDVFERYLTRQDPSSIKTISNLLERARITRRVTAHLMPKSSQMSFRESVMSIHDIARHSITSTPSVTTIRSISRFRTPSLLTMGTTADAAKISIAHRIVMARKEVEELRRKLEQLQRSARKRKASMRAEIEEIEIRLNEAHEAKEEFEEEVVIKSVDPITGKIPAERVIRFVEEWLRSASTIIERLRLKTATARTQIRKARQQLVQRMELGESLHAIDFEKLNIENQDYAKMLEEKSLYVIDMKRIAGRYHLKLTQHKQKLEDLLLTLRKVEAEILSKQKQIEQLSGEKRIVEVKVRRMKKELKNLLIFMENHIAPDIFDFVVMQEEFVKLERTFKLLQRRRNIERIIYEEYKRQMETRRRPYIGDDGKRSWSPRRTSDTIFPIVL